MLYFSRWKATATILTALIICFASGQPIIDWLRRTQKHGQPIREDGPERHLVEKKGTPTMGGALILVSVVITTLLWADLENRFVWVVLAVTIGFGVETTVAVVSPGIVVSSLRPSVPLEHATSDAVIAAALRTIDQRRIGRERRSITWRRLIARSPNPSRFNRASSLWASAIEIRIGKNNSWRRR